MKFNYLMKRLSNVGRFLATALFCVSAIAFVWQGASFSKTTAMAAPVANLIAEADLGSKVQGKVSEDTGRTKNFIRDAKESLKETANKNAEKVEDATDNNGSFIERKAKRDAARIAKRAEEDANRTEKVLETEKNVVERAVDSVKDAFSK
ncbi:hypothetical protein F7734_13560 [Scytonema sp. UIC 10036]|uniref:hypothetical protein n=1 Tax=Scytonema sp. UIC 10036 TaxID=2304196 RepID=UPI0012DA25A3|nr:hypothetical protein [Scytonema sp. UIC 10036]MUG93399.1 hypothetical protein [Scytonema sp. UIC 10036]